MAKDAKIALSAQELQLLLNKEWILTKRILIQKVDTLLGNAVPDLQELIKKHHWLPAEVAAANPKIHRGENYQGLPYVLLDYPAYFSKAGTMAVRSMFWWGNFFSVTLHLSGNYKTQFENTLLQKIDELRETGNSLCTGREEWEHHFGADNYTPIAALTAQQIREDITGKNFAKIAEKFNLELWGDMPSIIVRQTSQLLDLIAL